MYSSIEGTTSVALDVINTSSFDKVIDFSPRNFLISLYCEDFIYATSKSTLPEYCPCITSESLLPFIYSS